MCSAQPAHILPQILHEFMLCHECYHERYIRLYIYICIYTLFTVHKMNQVLTSKPVYKMPIQWPMRTMSSCFVVPLWRGPVLWFAPPRTHERRMFSTCSTFFWSQIRTASSSQVISLSSLVYKLNPVSSWKYKDRKLRVTCENCVENYVLQKCLKLNR